MAAEEGDPASEEYLETVEMDRFGDKVLQWFKWVGEQDDGAAELPQLKRIL